MEGESTAFSVGKKLSSFYLLKEGKTIMATFSLATQDGYYDKEKKWQNKETVWHNVLTFLPSEIQKLKNLKTGTRVKVTGSLSYREFEVIIEKGKTVKKQEALVIANSTELAPLIPNQQ